MLIYKQLDTTAIFVDTDAEFECYCNRHFMPAEWMWRGKRLTQSQPGFVEIGCDGPRYWMKILNCQKDYGDKISVKIVDADENESVESAARLKMKLEQPKFVSGLVDQTVDENRNVKLSCRINEPDQAVIWYYIDSLGNSKWIDPVDEQTFKVTSVDGLNAVSFKAKSFWSGHWVCKMDDSDFDTSGIVISDTSQLETTGIQPEIVQISPNLKLFHFIEFTVYYSSFCSLIYCNYDF